ncbi:MAG: hypothetical protein OHK0029_26960 [Armatimonadaceae bacterium]
MKPVKEPGEASGSVAPRSFPRNVGYARVFTAQASPVSPVEVYDALYSRGFLPGFTDPAGEDTPLADAGLAEAEFTVGGEGYRILSMTSSRGSGCLIRVERCSDEDLPDDYLVRRAVHKPKLQYRIQAGGPSNSDRNLCENLAEALMLMTSGVVEIGGLGTKGNRPRVYNSSWVGSIKTR